MKTFSYRQVHLDFHTSENIPAVGDKFDPEQFKAALKLGHVGSVTLFAKCHHGWSYHPTEVNEIHPSLGFDLLGAELKSCAEAGVNAPVYISAGLDEKLARRHPEWTVKSSRGQKVDFDANATYHLLCYNTPYLDILIRQIDEVMRKYHPVSVFLDISDIRHCRCEYCVKSMLEKGLDPDNDADVHRHAEDVYAEYCRRTNEAVHKYDPEVGVFHNAGNVPWGRRDIAAYDTHFELESLPTGGWGYDHFPMSAAYVRTFGKNFLGMTGKFHTTWGEFGGFKHPNALIYETSLSLALGAKCSIGDQLHPDGKMNMNTYELIGKAYSELEKKEKWAYGAENIADVAILYSGSERADKPDIGASRILSEKKYLFNVIDYDADFAPYKLILLPDKVKTDEKLVKKLRSYLDGGGKLLVSGSSALNNDRSAAYIDTGAEHHGTSPYDVSYMTPAPGTVITNGVTQYIMYGEAYMIKAKAGSEVLSYMSFPYFSRTPQHFSSHQHTPDKPDEYSDGAVINKAGNVCYIPWKIFTDYAEKGELQSKELVANAIEKLIGAEKTLSIGLPDRGVASLTYQKSENRYVVHALFTHTTVRGRGVEVIEDALPLYGIPVKVRCPEPERVYLAPQGTEIPFEYADGAVSFSIDRLLIHQMAVIDIKDKRVEE